MKKTRKQLANEMGIDDLSLEIIDTSIMEIRSDLAATLLKRYESSLFQDLNGQNKVRVIVAGTLISLFYLLYQEDREEERHELFEFVRASLVPCSVTASDIVAAERVEKKRAKAKK
jgi:hypothetical protein